MKIVALQAENLKRLVAVEIRPDGALVEITGKNGQGKTSVLDAIWWALEGASHIQAAPIRRGATEALIRLDLGDLKVTRKFRAKEEGPGFTTTITVETADGARFPSPQKVLDELVGALSFDPLAFTRMAPKEQLNTLKQFVPGVDFEGLENAHRGDFDARTEVNRLAKALRTQAAGITVPPDAPTEPVDESALVAKLEEAGQHNTDIETRKARRETALTDAARLESDALAVKQRADALQAEATALLEKSAGMIADAADLKAKVLSAPPLPAPIDTGALRAEISAARETNIVVANAKRRAELIEQAAAQEAKAASLTAAMARRERDKTAAIAAAKMPVAGVAFGDGAILLDGVPFDQASDAQQLQASIAIAAAMNPKLRVIRVRDGSLLDEDAMKLLAGFAEDNDMQIWVERVDSSGAVGFVLEDGHVRNAAAPAKSEAA